MSRYNTRRKDNGRQVSYGFDHALGYFYQEFDENDDCIVDEDSAFTGLRRSRLCNLLSNTHAPEQHITNVTLDLPI